MVWAVPLLHLCLKGTRLTIHTDHNFLKRILDLLDSTRRLTRWHLRLSEAVIDVVHRACLKYHATKLFFRLQTTGEDDVPLEDDLSLLTIDARGDNTGILVINANSDGVIPLNAHEGKSVYTPPTLEVLVSSQALDKYCKAASLNVVHAGS